MFPLLSVCSVVKRTCSALLLRGVFFRHSFARK